MIHPSAEIAVGAKIADHVRIGPFCRVAEGVTLEEGVILEPHVVLENAVHIGRDAHLYAFAALGNGQTAVHIGEGTVIREFTKIGVLPSDDLPVLIAPHCYIMAYVDIRSGVEIAEECIITNSVLLERESRCEAKVIVGAKASVAQACTIGRGSMIGGVSAVQGDIPPYCLVEGYPRAEIRGLNLVGMRRGFEDRKSIAEVKKVFMQLKREAFSPAAAETLLKTSNDLHARQFLAFVASHRV